MTIQFDGNTGIVTTGNVTANNFFGNFSGNVTVPGTNTEVIFNDDGIANGSLAFTFDKASNTVTVGGNLVSTTANVTGNLLAGTLTAGNTIVNGTATVNGDTTVNGNLTVSGNVSFIDIERIETEDPMIVVGIGPNGTPLTSNDGRDRGVQMDYYSNVSASQQTAFMGWINSTGNMIAASDVTIVNDVVTVNELGTFEAGNIFAATGDFSGRINADYLNSLATANGQNIYIDPTRTDIYNQNGSATQPFKTIAAAISYAESNDPTFLYSFILVGATYSETIDLNNTTLQRVSFTAMGRAIIAPPSGNSLQSNSNNSSLQQLIVRDLTFSSPVVVAGDGTANQFSTVIWQNVTFSSSAIFTSLNQLILLMTAFITTTEFRNIRYFYLDGAQSSPGGSAILGVNDTLPIPSLGLANPLCTVYSVQANVTFEVVGALTLSVQINDSRLGVTGQNYTVPAGLTLFSYSSSLRGNWTNNGTMILRNSSSDTVVLGTPPQYLGYFGGSNLSVSGTSNIADVNSAGNIIPVTDDTYSLGNATNQWKDLYVSGNTIYMSNVPLTIAGANILQVDGANVITEIGPGGTTIIPGNVEVNGDLSVDGNTTLTDLEVTGNIAIDKDLVVNGNIILNELEITGNVVIDANLTVNSNVQFNGDLDLTGNLSVDGNVVIDSNLTVNSNVQLNSDLAVTGNIDVTGNVVIDSNLSVNGTAVLSELEVTGNANIVGNTTTGGILTDNYYYANGQPVDFEQPAGSNTQVQYNSDGDFGASANLTFNSTTNVLTVAGNISGANLVTAGVVAATGNITGGNLTTAGTANVGTLAVTGNASVVGNAVVGNVRTQYIYGTPAGSNIVITTTGVDSSVTVVPTGAGSLDISNKRITSLATPVADSDAATKLYVDEVAQGLKIKDSVYAASATTLPPYVYNNGTGGVGATITANNPGTLSLDGTSPTVGERVLIKNETGGNEPYNGVYDVTVAGDGSTPFVLTRAADFNNSPTGEVAGAFVFIQQGTTLGDTGWVCITDEPVIIGTTPLQFVQFSGAGTYLAGSGLTLTGEVFSVNVDNDTTEITPQGNVIVKPSANLVTPNIGNAVGNSLTLTGNLTAANLVVDNVEIGNLIVDEVDANTANISGNAAFGGVLTDNYYYANGQPVDFEQPAGSNTQVQYNSDGDFGASSNFTFNQSTNVLTVTGNIQSNVLGITGNITSGNISTGALTSTTSINANTLVVSNTMSVGSNTQFSANVAIANNLTVGGNITVDGNINLIGNINEITGNTGVFYGEAGTGFDALYAGIESGFAVLDQTVVQTSGNFNGFVQINFQNINTGSKASTDFVCTADIGNNDAYYVNMGIASSTFDGSEPNSLGNAVFPNDGYVYTQDGNMVLGTPSTGKVTKIVTGGQGTDFQVATFNPGGTESTSTTTGGLVVLGGAGIGGNLYSLNVHTTGAFATTANISGNITAGNVAGGNLVSANFVAGTLTTAAQPNITSVGSLTSLTVTGNITGGNIDTAGVITATGNITGGNLSGTNVTGTLTTAAQPNITSVGTLTSLAVTGNITGGNVAGGNLVSANFLTGTLTTAAQPNITSVGTLTGLGVTGNITGGNLNTAGLVVASRLESNIATGTAPLTVASTTLVTNLNADLLDGYNSSITTVANTVVVRDSNGNIDANTFVGNTLSISGNATITGNLNVGGNITYTNITDLNISDPIVGLGRGPNNTPLTSNDGKDRGAELWYYTTSEKSAFFGYDNSTGKLIAAIDVTNSVDVITVNSYGNLVVGGLEATTGSVSGNLSAGNVDGGNLVTANFFTGTLTTAAQPNITSVGTLTSLAVTGNVTAGNVGGGNLVTANFFTGTLTTAAQPNVTSVGTLTSLAVTGNVTTGNVSGTTGAFTNVSGNGDALTSLNASNISSGTLAQARLANASLTVNGTSITLGSSGTVTANAQTLTGTSLNSTVTGSSLTSVGTLGSLTVSGTATVGTVQTSTLTTGASGTAGSITGNWTLTSGSRLEATYADLAERYASDEQYEPGTILMIGGTAEVTIANKSGQYRLAGIVSTAPAYVLNSTIPDSVIVALTGRVPCRVVGKIQKGDLITISDIPGVGTSVAPSASGTVIGRALENYDSTEVGVIEVKVDQC